MKNTNIASALLARFESGTLSWSTAIGVGAAVTFGVVVLFAGGILGAEVLHNAAHDARHVMSFPCH